MNIDFKPLFNNVLVKPIEPESKTIGGIIIPDNAKEKPAQGLVIAVGEGKVLNNGAFEETAVEKGDIIMYKKWNVSDIKIDGKNYVIMEDSEILGILKKQKS